MKRFFRFLFFAILLAAAATVFYAGFATLKVPQGKIGVIVSKTGSVNQKIVKNGDFVFRPEFLIPNNASVLVFESKNLELSGEKSQNLENAEMFEKILSTSENFEYSFSYKIVASLQQDFFVGLVEKNLARNQDEADNYLRARLEDLFAATDDYFKSQYASLAQPDNLDLENAAEILKFSEKFSDLNIVQFSAWLEKKPDLPLYAAAKSAHEKYISDFKAKIDAELSKKADFSTRDFYEIERATKWAQAMRENPEIKDFLNSEFYKNARAEN